MEATDQVSFLCFDNGELEAFAPVIESMEAVDSKSISYTVYVMGSAASRVKEGFNKAMMNPFESNEQLVRSALGIPENSTACFMSHIERLTGGSDLSK